MRIRTLRHSFYTTASAAALLVAAAPALAQDDISGASQDADENPAIGPVEAFEPELDAGEETIIVTGSRIRRSRTDTATPVIAVDQQSLTDRGFVTSSDALNQVTSIIPQLSLSASAGEASGSGRQFPNLFGLGPGRTLTLVNGRRFVTSSESFSSAGGGNAQVDANVIPTGLIERIEIVQAGGAVIYGTDAIAGVVNYILRDDFSGIEFDGQAGISHFGDYPTYSARVTAGHNFGDRGNVAINVEWSKTELLGYRDRPRSNLSRVSASSGNTDPNDGIPSLMEVLNARFAYFNENGLIYTVPAPVPLPPCNFQVCFLRDASGQPLQFAPGGGLQTYDPGTLFNIPFAQGGQGFRFTDLSSLRSGLERLTGNAIGHYELTDNITLRGEALYARTEGVDQPQYVFNSVLSPAASGSGPIAFTRFNGFLSPETVAELSARSPAFANGAPLFLSKAFPDLLLDNYRRFDTETYRGLLALEGDFQLGRGDFYWSIGASYGRVEGTQSGFGVVQSRFDNAINSVRLPSGQVVCAINADADPSNDDAACAPINPFGRDSVSPEARAYVNAPTGFSFQNEQVDFLATLGGNLFDLPGGTVGFSLAYEHRDEKVAFDPFEANQTGIVRPFTRTEPASGGYNTDEFSAEVLIPIVGGDFTLPLVNELELTAAARYVDNNLAGTESLWSIAGRWEVTRGVTLRASRSRNFRAPTLTQLLYPSTTSLTFGGQDPCDADRINQGPDPATRRANCLALFEANPGYGVLADGSNAGASAAERLANFQNPGENFTTALITAGGNPDLRNEIANTLTYGIVLQPRFIPGLTITIDRIEVDLTDGLSPFANEDFMAACYDNVTPPPGVCEAFARLANPDGTNPGGTTIAGTSTTFNAGVEEFRGEVYNVNYLVPLERMFSGDPGQLELSLEATHTSLRRRSVTGVTFERFDNTLLQPDWVGRFDARYTKGPFRFTYQILYRDKVLAAPDATIENNPNPIIDASYLHNVSVQFDLGRYALRAGVQNLFNTEPSYPTLGYGDILGRQYFVGARIRF